MQNRALEECGGRTSSHIHLNNAINHAADVTEIILHSRSISKHFYGVTLSAIGQYEEALGACPTFLSQGYETQALQPYPIVARGI